MEFLSKIVGYERFNSEFKSLEDSFFLNSAYVCVLTF